MQLSIGPPQSMKHRIPAYLYTAYIYYIYIYIYILYIYIYSNTTPTATSRTMHIYRRQIHPPIVDKNWQIWQWNLQFETLVQEIMHWLINVFCDSPFGTVSFITDLQCVKLYMLSFGVQPLGEVCHTSITYENEAIYVNFKFLLLFLFS